MRLDELLSFLAVAFLIIVALFLVCSFRSKPHKTLIRLVVANIVLDAIAIAIWSAFPATQWSIYRLGFSVVSAEAVLAAALFALTLFWLIKRKKRAPFLAVTITITQRVFATYVFSLSIANALTLIWSLLIIYFAQKDARTPTEPQ